MFSESLLEVAVERSRRGWSLALAWAMEATLLAVFVILPIWQPQALPHVARWVSDGVVGPPPGEAPRAQAQSAQAVHRQNVDVVDEPGVFRQPHAIPRGIDNRPEPAAEPYAGPCAYCVVGSTEHGNGRGSILLGDIIRPFADPGPPPPPKPSVTRVPVSSGVQSGFLMRQVQPVYPRIAITARIEGTVLLAAIINRDGTIQNLRALNGPPMLIGAAIDAVRKWRYKPYLLNGEPVEVETQITVNFKLAH